jgi:hypothetical protein
VATDLHVDAPIFFETLAAAAHCEPADAVEHFGELDAKPHPVESFLEQYALPAPPAE